MAFGVRVRGVKEAQAGVKTAVRAYSKAMHAAAFTVLGEILGQARADAPLVSGELRESVFEERTVPARGGFGAEHADDVHERTGGRGWKFLQRRLMSEAGGVPQRVAELTMRYAAENTTIDNVRAEHPEKARTGGRR